MKNPYSGKAHEFIRRKILSGEFKPGHRLKTRELTHMIKVSATPVREALRLLENEGLVEIQPRLGASVKSLDVVEFKELSELRCALECLAAELAAVNRTEAELLEIENALLEMARIVKEHGGNLDDAGKNALRTADIQFHIAILAAAHNRTLYSEVLRLQVVHRINSPVNRGLTHRTPAESLAWQNSVYDCHQRIFAGIRERDPEAARLAMKEHIQAIVDRAVLAMAKSLHGNSVARVTTEAFGYIE